MKKLKKIIVVILAITVTISCNSLIYAQNSNGMFEQIDNVNGIYQLENISRNNMISQEDTTLLNDNGQYYIHLEGDLYVKAEKKVFQKNDSLISLLPETREIVSEIFEADENGSLELVGGMVEVYAPQNELNFANSNLLSSSYPVVNEQVRYTAVGNEIVIASGNNAFEDYANRTLNNAAVALIHGVISALHPASGNIITVARLFPSRYNEIRSYRDWTFGVKLQEEKVVQLSWVHANGSIYLGAQTQFATVKYGSILASALHDIVVDNSPFLYYKTPNYQSPENIARQYYSSDAWVEQIHSYDIEGVTINSLSN